jgi:hypothetical protein
MPPGPESSSGRQFLVSKPFFSEQVFFIKQAFLLSKPLKTDASHPTP